jgi:hypothetical protein
MLWSSPKALFKVEITVSIPALKLHSALNAYAIRAISSTESPRFLALRV